MLVTTKAMLKKAQKEGYAVGAFNTSDLEITKAIISAAEKTGSPVIVQTSEKALEYAGINEMYSIVAAIARMKPIPVALHLDHGSGFSAAKRCISSGWTSVMIDGSKCSFKENVKLTKKVADYAHKHSIPVEAELGVLKGVEDNVQAAEGIYTNPEQAGEFVKQTGIDSLAVAIGTSHGAYKFKRNPKIDLKRLKEIRERVSVPLVLHGASGVPKEIVRAANKYGAKLEHTAGVPDSQIRKAIGSGICKINIDTDLRLAFDMAVRKELKENPGVFDPRQILKPAMDEIEKAVAKKIKLFGSCWMAGDYKNK